MDQGAVISATSWSCCSSWHGRSGELRSPKVDAYRTGREEGTGRPHVATVNKASESKVGTKMGPFVKASVFSTVSIWDLKKSYYIYICIYLYILTNCMRQYMNTHTTQGETVLRESYVHFPF